MKPIYIDHRLQMLLLVTIIMNVSEVIFSQETECTEVSMQQAVDTALTNNLSIQNAILQVDCAKTRQKGTWSLDPPEFKYQWGQIYSSNPDHYLEVNQNFGSIPAHIQTIRKAKCIYNYELTAYEIARRQLIAEVKSAYLFWQYQYAVSKVREEKAGLYQQLHDIAYMRYETGDITLLEKVMATSTVSQINTMYLNSLDDLAIAGLKFQFLLSSGSKLLPYHEEFDMYEITKSTDTSSYLGEVMVAFYETKYEVARAEESISKSHYFPEISAGFFSQEIENEKGLYGWQIMIAVPIWFNRPQAEVIESGIESQIAKNELEYNKNRIALEIESLLYDLNKYFRLIRHYQQEALPQAEVLIKTSENQLQAEEIDLEEFLQNVSLAMQIREEYLEVLNNYNQTAVQLEMYERQ